MQYIKGSEGMKFVHIADIHFDSPFVNLSDREGFGDLRRLDQRKAFRKMIDYVKDNQIPYLFVSLVLVQVLLYRLLSRLFPCR